MLKELKELKGLKSYYWLDITIIEYYRVLLVVDVLLVVSGATKKNHVIMILI